MLKRSKFPPLIQARASSTNCTMGNLATQHAYIQSMLNLPRFISFLVYKSSVILSTFTVYGLSKKWFPFGGWLYYRPLLLKIHQRSCSRLVVGCIIGHYCLRFIKEVVPFWWLVILSTITV
jgi:hypothetical protein